MIEYCRLNIDYLRSASLRAVGEPEAGGSIIKKDHENGRASRLRHSSNGYDGHERHP
jgi:hypothetical protein